MHFNTFRENKILAKISVFTVLRLFTVMIQPSNMQDTQILQQDLDRPHERELQWDMEFSDYTGHTG